MKTIVFVLLLSLVSVVHAVPPQSMNYQAYLVDNVSGLPIDGSRDLIFRIYPGDAGGTAVWTDTLTVVVSKGLFSVELGGALNPLPKASMVNPLWLGVQVVGDTLEMSPRSPLTSVNNAFRAEDADTLQGQTAASLDQSGDVAANAGNITTLSLNLGTHSTNPSAHHAKTTSYADLTSGQVTAAFIAADAINASHIAANAVAASEIAANAVGASEIATGAVASAEIQDGSITTADIANGAVTAAKINNAGLDADTVDGIHASAFMPAGADLWVNTTGDAMTGNLTTTGAIGIGTASPGYKLSVQGGLSGYLAGIYNENTGGSSYGLYSEANSFGAIAGGALAGYFRAWGSGTNGSATGVQAYAYAYGAQPAYAIFADAVGGGTSNREYAFYGRGQGYFSDNVGIGLDTTPDHALHVYDNYSSQWLAYFLNDNNTAGTNTLGLQATADGSGTGTGQTTGAEFLGIGGSTGGNAFGAVGYARAYGSSPAYAIFADGTGGDTSGPEYAFYGYGRGYFSQTLLVNGDVDVAGNVLLGYELVTGTAQELSGSVSSCFFSSSACYYGAASVACPVGKKPIGGGCNTNVSYSANILANYPTANGWTCRAMGAVSTYTLTPYAICARVGS